MEDSPVELHGPPIAIDPDLEGRSIDLQRRASIFPRDSLPSDLSIAQGPGKILKETDPILQNILVRADQRAKWGRIFNIILDTMTIVFGIVVAVLNSRDTDQTTNNISIVLGCFSSGIQLLRTTLNLEKSAIIAKEVLIRARGLRRTLSMLRIKNCSDEEIVTVAGEVDELELSFYSGDLKKVHDQSE